MQFPKRSAMNIVQEIGDVIGEKINMMDSEGVIIASTDPARMKTFHAGAKKLVDERLDELVVRYDGEFNGARQGINLPITFEEKIVGVIGVTGPYEKVRKYGQIIKKMTEILILDIALSEQLGIENRARSRFLNDWVHASPAEVATLAESARSLHIDITIPRRVLLLSVVPLRNDGATETQVTIEGAERRVSEFCGAGKDIIVFKLESRIALLVPAQSDEGMLTFASGLKREVEGCCPVSLAIGIDAEYRGYQYMAAAFERAERALRTCLRSPSRQPRLYDSLNMEIFLGEIPDAVKAEYVKRIFRNCAPEEIAACISMLELYYECEGSVSEASKRLFIHKNTLQYRLRRLADTTGYDPRSIKFSSLYYNAIHFYRDISNII